MANPRDKDMARAQKEYDARQEKLDPGETGLDRLQFLMNMKKAGWRAVRGEEEIEGETVGTWCILPDPPNHPRGSPEQVAQEKQWEADYVIMAANQKTLMIPAKPQTTGLREKRRGGITRGD